MHELQEVHRDVKVPEGTAGEAQNCSDTPRTLAHSLSRTAVAGCLQGSGMEAKQSWDSSLHLLKEKEMPKECEALACPEQLSCCLLEGN